ncbi:glycosyl transferase family 1 [Bacillus sp. FJAT-27916]|uniref:glycosyltransferase n=1 Tax=Bacillus sp. FJAT-27916 TaxID=1679169 RepID=UPI00067173BF|nr:glycosyltransferase [Bacillus sp. FJAT-27916]KMY43010.1 glycosyl transferase family 1 [Bacillus sp. FJAT-27916]
MNIMVFDVPAETGGALSILNDFYNEVKQYNNKNINWIFVISKPQLYEIENIRVLKFPWVKKSWFHRLYFDNFVAPKLVKKYKIDRILSLQNVIIPNTDVRQILYIHQPLPFVKYKFTFKENKLFWVYQNILSRKIFKSIKKASKVVVQTEWMKNACSELVDKQDSKISVVPPKTNIHINRKFIPTKESFSTFFYPASPVIYKNHKIIVEACQKLSDQDYKGFKVIFTLKGNENNNILNLKKIIRDNQLPIEFIGDITRDKVYDYYSKSILIFPSYIETFGLPILEAKSHNTIVIASDSQFSHEILGEYENKYFFDPFDSDQLAQIMKNILSKQIYNDVKEDSIKIKNRNLINEVLL